MGNMSYCRFYNTLSDLRDCYNNMDDEPISSQEVKARHKLIKLCCLIAGDYADDDGEPVFDAVEPK